MIKSKNKHFNHNTNYSQNKYCIKFFTDRCSFAKRFKHLRYAIRWISIRFKVCAKFCRHNCLRRSYWRLSRLSSPLYFKRITHFTHRLNKKHLSLHKTQLHSDTLSRSIKRSIQFFVLVGSSVGFTWSHFTSRWKCVALIIARADATSIEKTALNRNLETWSANLMRSRFVDDGWLDQGAGASGQSSNEIERLSEVCSTLYWIDHSARVIN